MTIVSSPEDDTELETIDTEGDPIIRNELSITSNTYDYNKNFANAKKEVIFTKKLKEES